MEPINLNEDSQTDFPKGNPFEVPDGYFDRFPSRIAEIIEEKETTKIYTLKTVFKSIPFLAVAAMLVTVSMIGLKLLNQKDNSITKEEISHYIYQHGIIEEIEVDELVNYSSQSSLNEMNIRSTASKEELTVIEHILMEEDFDMNDLINEL
jgi:hypothetical protein